MSTESDPNIELIKSKIGTFPDFPKPGIIFKDLFTALVDGEVCIAVKNVIISYIKKECPKIDAVVGLDARGFLFSLLIAAELGIGCIPIRKKGKLPGECISVKYALEYGEDVFEMQKNSIKAGQNILIIDDLLATGGTFSAAVQLVRSAGGNVVKCVAIIELLELNGRSKVDCDVHSFISY